MVSEATTITKGNETIKTINVESKYTTYGTLCNRVIFQFESGNKYCGISRGIESWWEFFVGEHVNAFYAQGKIVSIQKKRDS